MGMAGQTQPADNRTAFNQTEYFNGTQTVNRQLEQAMADLTELIQQAEEGTPSATLLEELLNRMYDLFRGIIPYNRIGFSLIEPDGQTVRAVWARSDRPLKLSTGYTSGLKGSSLEFIVQSGYPRIINDLEAYLQRKPRSEATRLLVAEGMRSSLTCPLIASGKPVGFLFFTSIYPKTYSIYHIKIFKQIAHQLSQILDRGRFLSQVGAAGQTPAADGNQPVL